MPAPVPQWIRRVWRVVLLVVIVAGFARLRFDTEILELLPADLPVARGLKLYQRHFTDARQLLVAVEAPDSGQATAAARGLAEMFRAHPALVAAADWQPPWRERPGDNAELLAYLWLQQPPPVLAEFRERLSPEGLDATLAAARERLTTSLSPEELMRIGRDPFGFSQLGEAGGGGLPDPGQGEEGFASADGRFRVVMVEAQPDLGSYPSCAAWLRSIRGLVEAERAEGRLPEDVRVRFTGRPVFVTEIAGGMERDMSGSMAGTLATIGVLFWLTHRRWGPLVRLLAVLVGIQVVTLALAGLGLGRINVVSLGFAAILFGLAEDFGIVIYQEARSHPGLAMGELRRRVVPGIAWSALTTSCAFLLLNLSQLPGLRQLGTLVALGIAVAALAMVTWYLPRVWRLVQADPDPSGGRGFALFQPRCVVPAAWMRVLTGVLGLGAMGCLALNGIQFDRSPNVLAPKESEARQTLEDIRQRLGGGQDPLWVIVEGRDGRELAGRLEAVDGVLRRLEDEGAVLGYRLPISLVPRSDHAAGNLGTAAGFATLREPMREALARGGFTGQAWGLADGVMEAWEGAVREGADWMPSQRTGQWILRQALARGPEGHLALGLVHPKGWGGTSGEGGGSLDWIADVERPGVTVSGWSLLGTRVFGIAARDLPRVLIPVGLVVLVTLALAYRSGRDVLLSLATLGLAGLLTLAAMSVLGIRWNLMNLMAIPLVLGMGVDFCIHMQLALHREGGDAGAVRASVGRALLLAGSTTVAGFVSLAFSTNAGLASLGLVCALGIAMALAVSVYLLPAWRGVFRARARARHGHGHGH